MDLETANTTLELNQQAARHDQQEPRNCEHEPGDGQHEPGPAAEGGDARRGRPGRRCRGSWRRRRSRCSRRSDRGAAAGNRGAERDGAGKGARDGRGHRRGVATLERLGGRGLADVDARVTSGHRGDGLVAVEISRDGRWLLTRTTRQAGTRCGTSRSRTSRTVGSTSHHPMPVICRAATTTIGHAPS